MDRNKLFVALVRKIKRYADQGISVEDIFYDEKEYNADIFAELIEQVNDYLLSNREQDVILTRESLMEDFSYILNKLIECRGREVDHHYMLCGGANPVVVHRNNFDEFRVVISNIAEFIKVGLLKLGDGGLVKNNIKVDVCDAKRMQSLRCESVFQMIEGVIDRNGDFYLCLNLHEPTLNYLLACGKCVSGSVRVQQDSYSGRIDFSSFESYLSFMCFDGDKHLCLTERQAETMANLYETLKRNPELGVKTDGDCFYNLLARSSNLGYSLFEFSKSRTCEDFNVVYAKRNIRRLKKYYVGEFDDERLMGKIVENFATVRLDAQRNKSCESVECEME